MASKLSTKLNILVVDKDRDASVVLESSLNKMPETVEKVVRLEDIYTAEHTSVAEEINAVFIDPISVGLDEAESFIFGTRRRFPWVVFVLFIDVGRVAKGILGFYAGERSRFKHYYKLDKSTPAAMFSGEVTAAVIKCLQYLGISLQLTRITELDTQLSHLPDHAIEPDTATIPTQLLKDIREELSALKTLRAMPVDKVLERSVFLSYRFAETEYIEGLRELLQREGFSVVTGQDASSYISQAILERISASEFFLSLMTKDQEKQDGSYTTSPWLLEEKGAALAMNKRVVLMVEDDVSDIGGLQGDWQRIHFSTKSFMSAAIRAVDQLKAFSS